MTVKSLGTEEAVDRNYFKYHFLILKIFGICIVRPANSVVRIIYNVYALWMALLFFVFYTTAEIIDLYQNMVDIYSSAFEITYIISHLLALFKMGLLFIFRRAIETYCQNLETGVFVPDVKRGGIKEITYINQATKTGNLQVAFFNSSVFVMVGLHVFNTILNNDSIQEHFDTILNETVERHVRLTPYKCWLPFEPIETPYYEIGCFYQVASCLFFGMVIGSTDSLICGILCHIKAQFLILINSLESYMDRMEILMRDDGFDVNLWKYRFSEFRNGDTLELFPKYFQRYADRCFRDCVNHHQQIIELARKAENTFNYLMLAQFMGSLMLICFQLFQLSVSNLTSYDAFSMICYIILATYQVFIFCWHGNEIMVVSDRLPQVIYETNWLITSISTRKSLLIMMIRAYKPIKMTAGKFAFLSLETFVTVIRGAGSYFMVLRNMNEMTEE